LRLTHVDEMCFVASPGPSSCCPMPSLWRHRRSPLVRHTCHNNRQTDTPVRMAGGEGSRRIRHRCTPIHVCTQRAVTHFLSRSSRRRLAGPCIRASERGLCGDMPGRKGRCPRAWRASKTRKGGRVFDRYPVCKGACACVGRRSVSVLTHAAAALAQSTSSSSLSSLSS
jgi:hypothetical protein